MGNRNFNRSNNPGSSTSMSREQRVARAKRVITRLVDQGVPFNPAGVSEFTRNRAVENLNMAAGRRNVPGTRSGSTEAARVLMAEEGRVSAPRPDRSKMKGPNK